jgi:hypothetical protein
MGGKTTRHDSMLSFLQAGFWLAHRAARRPVALAPTAVLFTPGIAI